MFAFILQLPSVAKYQVMFTLYRVTFALAKNWPYRIGLMFTHKNGDFRAISVTGRSYEAPISKVESHISDRCSYYTGYSVNIASDWNLDAQTSLKYAVRWLSCLGIQNLKKIAEDVTRFLRRNSRQSTTNAFSYSSNNLQQSVNIPQQDWSSKAPHSRMWWTSLFSALAWFIASLNCR